MNYKGYIKTKIEYAPEIATSFTNQSSNTYNATRLSKP